MIAPFSLFNSTLAPITRLPAGRPRCRTECRRPLVVLACRTAVCQCLTPGTRIRRTFRAVGDGAGADDMARRDEGGAGRDGAVDGVCGGVFHTLVGVAAAEVEGQELVGGGEGDLGVGAAAGREGVLVLYCRLESVDDAPLAPVVPTGEEDCVAGLEVLQADIALYLVVLTVHGDEGRSRLVNATFGVVR